MQQSYGATPATLSYTWQYDPAGNVVADSSPDGSDTLGSDKADQLQSASLTAESYTYDQNGNRTGNGEIIGADNRLLFDGTYTYTYDKNGNRTAKFIDANHDGVPGPGDTNVTLYTWDPRNRLVDEVFEANYGTLTTMITYSSDYLDRQIGYYEWSGGEWQPGVYTVYDGQDAYLEVSDGGFPAQRRHDGGGHATRPVRSRGEPDHRHGQLFGHGVGRSGMAWATTRGRSATWCSTTPVCRRRWT